MHLLAWRVVRASDADCLRIHPVCGTTYRYRAVSDDVGLARDLLAALAPPQRSLFRQTLHDASYTDF